MITTGVSQCVDAPLSDSADASRVSDAVRDASFRWTRAAEAEI